MIEKVEELLKKRHGEDTFEKKKALGHEEYMTLSVKNQYKLETKTKKLMENGFSILTISEILKVSPYVILAVVYTLNELNELEIPKSFSTLERTDEELKEEIAYLFYEEDWTLFGITEIFISHKADSIDNERITKIIEENEFVKSPKITESVNKTMGVMEKVKELHEQGLSIQEIREHVPRAEVTIRQYLSNQGLKPNPSIQSLARKKRIQERRNSVINLYRKGYAVKEICKTLNIPSHTAYTDIYYMKDLEQESEHKQDEKKEVEQKETQEEKQ